MLTSGRWSLCCVLLVLTACDDGAGPPPPAIPPVASVSIVSGDSVLSISDSGRYVAELREANGDLIDMTPTWSVSNGTLASIDASGALATTNAGAGTLYVIAEADGVRDSMELRVTQSWFAVSVGENQACAYDTSRQMWCWGVSRGTTQPVDGLLPSRVESSAQFSAVASGISAACGVVNGDGTAYCWGQQSFGNLGIGNVSGATPQPIAGGFLFDHIALGREHGCGLNTVQQIVCWGKNAYGEVGDSIAGSGGTSGRAPTVVVGGRTWRQVAAKGYLSCGIAMDRTVYCWGVNDGGVPGWPDSVVGHRNYPVRIESSHTYSAIGIGSSHQCGLTEAGVLECWGRGSNGRLGNGSTATTVVKAPQPVVGGHDLGAFSVGEDHTCALDPDGHAWCWGSGPLGNATVTESAVPVAVAGNHRFIALSAGTSATCGLTLGSAVYCWGSGNLGDGTGVGSQTPVRVRDP